MYADRRSLAKRRSSRRRREAGAAMFIVSMTLAVLASVGVFALASAAVEVKTSGNERQATQTHYLAEYGMVAAAHEVSGLKAQGYLGLMLGHPDTTCMSLPLPSTTTDPLTRACLRIESTELPGLAGASWVSGALVTTPYASTTPFSTTVAPGSLGPTPTAGGFFVELTNPTQTNAPPRYSTDLSLCFVQFTLTAAGLTQPLFGSSKTVVYENEGIETQRARIVAGPIACPR
jgi:hypothetical protein